VSGDHRLDHNAAEAERIRAAGGELTRTFVEGGHKAGALYTGTPGLANARGLGDAQNAHVLPLPEVVRVRPGRARFFFFLFLFQRGQRCYWRRSSRRPRTAQACGLRGAVSAAGACAFARAAPGAPVPRRSPGWLRGGAAAAQVALPPTGGRLVLASDGLWDAVSVKDACHFAKGLPAPAAAAQLLKLAVRRVGRADDVTVTVVDLLPAEPAGAALPPLLGAKQARRCSGHWLA